MDGGSGNTPMKAPETVKTEPLSFSGLGKWSQVGEERVKVDRVETGLVSDVDSEERGGELSLIITIAVENLSKTRKLEYRRWDDGTLGREAKLADSFGNEYQSRLPNLTYPKGRPRATIYPGDPGVVDVLLFQKPVATVKEMTLTLPAQLGEGEHVFHLRRE